MSLNTRKLHTTLLSAVAVLALSPAVALAQTASPDDSAPSGANAQPAEEEAGADIIVTATTVARRAQDTPLAVSSLDANALTKTSTINQADVLNTIPTIKADGGGGEVAANVFVRGLPSGGQYQFTPLEYDGVPVLSSFGLNSSAYDVYYRNDLGLERLEFVRGGVSNLFGPGSVAGLINYITKTGGNRLEGTAQLEWAERGSYKGDVAISGPLGGGFYFALSGWYRSDAGPIRTGLDTKGYQVRGNLNLHSPSGVAFEVKIACIRALDKDFLPQAAPAVAQTAGSGRIRPRSRCFLAQGRRFSAQRTDLSSRFRSV